MIVAGRVPAQATAPPPRPLARFPNSSRPHQIPVIYQAFPSGEGEPHAPPFDSRPRRAVRIEPLENRLLCKISHRPARRRRCKKRSVGNGARYRACGPARNDKIRTGLCRGDAATGDGRTHGRRTMRGRRLTGRVAGRQEQSNSREPDPIRYSGSRCTTNKWPGNRARSDS